MPFPDVVVVGAGVAGLTTALCLRQRGYRVRVVAREVSPATTSDVPAALWYPYKVAPRERALEWARITHARLRALAGESDSGIRFRSGIEVFRAPAPDPWWRDAVIGFRRATPAELPAGTVDGHVFEAPVVETPLYMPWLRRRLAALGSEVELARVDDLAAVCPRGGAVVNCSGLGARALARDPSVFASRGQLVLLEPLPLERFLLDESASAAITYVIPRGDALVVGATAEDGVESTAVDPAATAAILARARALLPELAAAQTIGERVGLRPCRGQVRLEAERLGDGRTVVHNYGHGGAGFTLSWGCGEEAARLVEAALGFSG